MVHKDQHRIEYSFEPASMTAQCNGAYSNKDSYPLRPFETGN